MLENLAAHVVADGVAIVDARDWVPIRSLLHRCMVQITDDPRTMLGQPHVRIGRRLAILMLALLKRRLHDLRHYVLRLRRREPLESN